MLKPPVSKKYQDSIEQGIGCVQIASGNRIITSISKNSVPPDTIPAFYSISKKDIGTYHRLYIPQTVYVGYIFQDVKNYIDFSKTLFDIYQKNHKINFTYTNPNSKSTIRENLTITFVHCTRSLSRELFPQYQAKDIQLLSKFDKDLLIPEPMIEINLLEKN